jgi:hypothetical protein
MFSSPLLLKRVPPDGKSHPQDGVAASSYFPRICIAVGKSIRKENVKRKHLMLHHVGWRSCIYAGMVAFASPIAAQEPEGHVTAPTIPAFVDGLPPPARAMLEAAARTEDAAQVAAVAYAASEVYPDHADAINEYGDYLRGVISPLSGLRIETVLAKSEPKEKADVPPPVVRTAEQQVESAPPPKFLDLATGPAASAPRGS